MSGSFTLFGHSFSYPLSLLPTETTFTLFEYEYHVPLLPSALAAYMGTATELLPPVFLFWIWERATPRWCCSCSTSAVLSYPDLNDAGLAQHQVWVCCC